MVAPARDSRETRKSIVGRYDEICAAHEWRVPQRYNIAEDCCDKHPPDKLAMIHEQVNGVQREVTSGELQALSNQAANLLGAQGVARRRPRRGRPARDAQTAAMFFGIWKLGALLLSMSVLYGDDGITHRLRDSAPPCSSPTRRTRRASQRVGCRLSCSRPICSPSTPPPCTSRLTRQRTIPHSCTTRRARPSRRRGSCTHIATCWGTKSSSTATRSRRASAFTGWASGRGRRGSRPCSGRGASARCSASISAKAASTRTGSSTSFRATACRTCSRRRLRCAR